MELNQKDFFRIESQLNIEESSNNLKLDYASIIAYYAREGLRGKKLILTANKLVKRLCSEVIGDIFLGEDYLGEE